MIQNRRKHHRIPSIGPVCIAKLRGEAYEVKVIDESIGGIRVGNLKLDNLRRNELVEIQLDDSVILGIARSVSSNTDDTYQIGIERVKKPVDVIDQKAPQLLGQFIRFQGTWVYCIIDEYVGANRARIQLVGGKEFAISRSQIFQLTIEERKEMLHDPAEFEATTFFYRSMDPMKVFPDVDSVIQEEFQMFAG